MNDELTAGTAVLYRTWEYRNGQTMEVDLPATVVKVGAVRVFIELGDGKQQWCERRKLKLPTEASPTRGEPEPALPVDKATWARLGEDLFVLASVMEADGNKGYQLHQIQAWVETGATLNLDLLTPKFELVCASARTGN